MAKNLIVDNMAKYQFPSTWNKEKEQPRERVLSFLASIVNMHINTFIRQIFKRNLIETSITPDADGNSKSDRYRTSKMKLNEEYVFSCSYDMSKLTEKLFKKYEKEITPEELEYYRRNLKPNRLHQLMIEIYFFNYTGSSQEFALLKNLDWFKLLLIMRKDLMRKFSVSEDTLLDSNLCLILTANIDEISLGERLYLKDLIKVYNSNMEDKFCYLERDNFYFDKILKEAISDEMKIFILYKNKVASAYIIFGLYEENIEIRECMALDGISYKEILALIYGYRDYYKNVSLASPNNSSLEFLFENQLSIEKIVKPFMMLRILDPLAIFKNLKLEKPYIIAPNHISALDVIFLRAFLLDQDIIYMTCFNIMAILFKN